MRTVLYANKRLSTYLRNNFILCWQSERPVPVVTIDFGNGRIVKRTITGNAAHYVMDSQGNLLDVIPGIYSAKTFQQVLTESFRLWDMVNDVSGFRRELILEAHHRVRLKKIRKAWNRDLKKLGLTNISQSKPSGSSKSMRAVRRTKSKRGIEIPVMQIVQKLPGISTLRQKTLKSTWQQMAHLHGENAKLDSGSLNFIKWQNPIKITASKALIENPLARLISNFEQSLAVDTIRNEYEFHSQIHQWFCEGEQTKGFTYINNRVFSEIFLTPANEPLLDLGNAYTGLRSGGIHN
ncbi:hypothetical protein [Candidatus Uabimicrobium sp. HlEnr_7]|uniref:hypothetical protein n=1 Tax=Candidatus Uabimicrobium helgolandensis TaxID=3095367 RepID=UPI0035578EC6